MEKVIGIAGAVFLVIVICVFVNRSKRESVIGWLSGNPFRVWVLVGLLLAYNSTIALIAGSFKIDSLVAQAVYFFIPTAAIFVYGLTTFVKERGNLLPLLIILALWLPIELRLMMKKMEVGGVGYPYVAACAVIYGLLMLAMTSKHDLSLDLSLPKSNNWLSRGLRWLTAPIWIPVQSFVKNWRAIGGMYLLLAMVMIPLTIAFGFIKPGLNPIAEKYWWGVPLILCTFWFFPALAEEIVFRAGIQNILIDKLGKNVGWFSASLIFGFAHINNSVKAGGNKFGFPNWHYVVFASLAGSAYGYLYQKLKERGNLYALGAAATLHALVDFTWWLLFKGAHNG